MQRAYASMSKADQKKTMAASVRGSLVTSSGPFSVTKEVDSSLLTVRLQDAIPEDVVPQPLENAQEVEEKKEEDNESPLVRDASNDGLPHPPTEHNSTMIPLSNEEANHNDDETAPRSVSEETDLTAD